MAAKRKVKKKAKPNPQKEIAHLKGYITGLQESNAKMAKQVNVMMARHAMVRNLIQNAMRCLEGQLDGGIRYGD